MYPGSRAGADGTQVEYFNAGAKEIDKHKNYFRTQKNIQECSFAHQSTSLGFGTSNPWRTRSTRAISHFDAFGSRTARILELLIGPKRAPALSSMTTMARSFLSMAITSGNESVSPILTLEPACRRLRTIRAFPYCHVEIIFSLNVCTSLQEHFDHSLGSVSDRCLEGIAFVGVSTSVQELGGDLLVPFLNCCVSDIAGINVINVSTSLQELSNNTPCFSN